MLARGLATGQGRVRNSDEDDLEPEMRASDRTASGRPARREHEKGSRRWRGWALLVGLIYISVAAAAAATSSQSRDLIQPAAHGPGREPKGHLASTTLGDEKDAPTARRQRRSTRDHDDPKSPDEAPSASHAGAAHALETEEDPPPPLAEAQANLLEARNQHFRHRAGQENVARASNGNQKLQVVRLFAPEAVQNGTNVTLDCMFKYDKRLDQRLTIKWYFENEPEPIYQWIPELNKRVYAEDWEGVVDKEYQVSEDVDFMLEAYKKLLRSSESVDSTIPADSTPNANFDESNSISLFGDLAASGATASWQIHRAPQHNQLEETPANEEIGTRPARVLALADQVASRRLLANRLSRLAKLGSDHSKHLLAQLRSALALDENEPMGEAGPNENEHEKRLNFSRFRALRLIRPGVKQEGKYTCSVSSLDSEDLRSTRLIVYEPPRSFEFNVTKTAGSAYNLTCHAGPTYPRPSLALFRYRAGQLEQPPLGAAAGLPEGSQARGQLRDAGRGHAPRPRLAAATLKQEPLAGVQSQLRISASRTAAEQTRPSGPQVAAEMAMLRAGEADLEPPSSPSQPLEANEPAKSTKSATPYEISAWALVDEASLSSNLVTQFECVLKIEGASFEQRQSLALQKGWHVNSSALMSRTTLVGVMSVLASFFCLLVALASALLIFKLLRGHANKSTRVHQGRGQPSMGARKSGGHLNAACELNSSASSSPSASESSDTTTSGAATITDNGGGGGGGGATVARDEVAAAAAADETNQSECSTVIEHPRRSRMNHLQAGANMALQPPRPLQRGQHAAASIYLPAQQQQQMSYHSAEFSPAADQSDGIYRVPEQRSSFGTRYVIGGGQQPLALHGAHVWPPTDEQRDANNNQAREPFGPARLQRGQQQAAYYQQGRGILANHLSAASGPPQSQQQQARPSPATISVNGKQLYC